jgi:nucleotide-binding universal stress UspA family protein
MANPRSFTIVVASDGSPDALAAAHAVTTFPWPAQARAHGVVVRTPVGIPEIPETVVTHLERSFAATADTTRKILARRWPDAPVRVLDGPIVDTIVGYANRVGARVIVVGSHGHGALARLLLGSTSLGVVRHMKRAALIVRGRAREFTRVVLAFDGSPTSRHAVELVAALPAPAGGEVTVIRVLEPVGLTSVAMLPSGARSAILEQARAVAAAEEKKAARESERVTGELSRAGWKVTVDLRHGAPLHELLAATKRARAHVLVLGARGHTALERLLLGSVAEGALHRSPVSVLLVR